MVVEARDLAVLDQGFAEDASEAIPLDDELLIPDGDDGAAPIEVDDASEAATEDGVTPFDFDSLPDADKSAIEARYRQQLETEFEERRREFQRTKDREVSLARAREMSRAKVYTEYLKEMGVDPHTIKALEFDVQQQTRQWADAQRKAEQQQAQTQQTQASDQAHITSEITSITGLMHEHAASVGLDIRNEKVAAQIDKHWQPVVKAAQVYLMYPTDETRAAFDTAKEVHKEWVTSLGAAQKRRKSASQTNDALGRQRSRGVQNTATGGGGAGVMSLKDTIAATQQANPALDYEQIHAIAYAQWQASKQR